MLQRKSPSVFNKEYWKRKEERLILLIWGENFVSQSVLCYFFSFFQYSLIVVPNLVNILDETRCLKRMFSPWTRQEMQKLLPKRSGWCAWWWLTQETIRPRHWRWISSSSQANKIRILVFGVPWSHKCLSRRWKKVIFKMHEQPFSSIILLFVADINLVDFYEK